MPEKFLKKKKSKLEKTVLDSKGKNLQGKALEKALKAEDKLKLAAAKNAIYKANQEKVVSPFGKEFKTGVKKSEKNYTRKEKHKSKY